MQRVVVSLIAHEEWITQQKPPRVKHRLAQLKPIVEQPSVSLTHQIRHNRPTPALSCTSSLPANFSLNEFLVGNKSGYRKWHNGEFKLVSSANQGKAPNEYTDWIVSNGSDIDCALILHLKKEIYKYA